MSSSSPTSSSWECPVCMEDEGRVPYVSFCGHSLCQECVGKLNESKCPFCKIDAPQWSKNWSFMPKTKEADEAPVRLSAGSNNTASTPRATPPPPLTTNQAAALFFQRQEVLRRYLPALYAPDGIAPSSTLSITTSPSPLPTARVGIASFGGWQIQANRPNPNRTFGDSHSDDEEEDQEVASVAVAKIVSVVDSDEERRRQRQHLLRGRGLESYPIDDIFTFQQARRIVNLLNERYDESTRLHFVKAILPGGRLGRKRYQIKLRQCATFAQAKTLKEPWSEKVRRREEWAQKWNVKRNDKAEENLTPSFGCAKP